MSRRVIGLGGRLAAVVLATALVLVLAGDGGRAATVPAVVNGQDPLEVLSLKVRPNVIVVLDSSGSMKWSLDPGHGFAGAPVNGGDHPRSKFWQAKQVLKTIVQNNQDKVSFLFGHYEQGNGATMQNTGATRADADTGQNRFMYWTSSDLSPSMVTTELSVQGSLDDALGRGLQSWQVIYDEWNTLWFEEEGLGTCQATLPGSFPKFYARGGSGSAPSTSTTPQNLSFELQTAMNGASCSPENTYSVSYATGSGEFRFTAEGPRRFRLLNRATVATNNISEALGGYATTGWIDPTFAGGGGPVLMDWSQLYVRRRSYRRLYTNGAHGLSVNDTCEIRGVDGFWDGVWTVTRIDANDIVRLSGTTRTNSYSVYRPPSTGTVVCTPASAGGTGGVARTNDPAYTLLYRQDTPPSNNASYGTGAYPYLFHNTYYEEVPPGSGTFVTNYQLRAGRHFNGEVISVTAQGQVCDMTFPTAAERTNPPTLTLQQVGAGCGSDVGPPVVFTWAGGFYIGGSNFCDGFRSRVDLVPCDLQSPPAPTQLDSIGPWLDNEAPLEADGSLRSYSERMDGTWAADSVPSAAEGGVKGYGSTPVAASLVDIRAIFTDLWNNGQAGATNMAAAPPFQLDPIKNHLNPKEKTIVLFITDGDDTCAGAGSDDYNALAAAYQAELLYRRIDANEGASSVQTFAIGYGGTVSGGRLDWIAWGGSGLGDTATGQPNVPVSSGRWNPGGTNESQITASLAPLRAQCTTCQDAFIAPDAATLASQLQAIIDQGASEGEFSAQQSITESIFEYVDLASNPSASPPEAYDARMPDGRYDAIVPTRIISSFTLPGFRGHIRAIQNDGTGIAVERWDAGEELRALVADGMVACDTTGNGGAVGQCTFSQLHASATDTTIALSGAAIMRRIYTTERNGVYNFDVRSLVNGTANQRVTLWPPVSSIIPPDYVSEAFLPGGLSFDAALGLPTDATNAAVKLQDLKDQLGACVGTNLPGACTSGSNADMMRAARREAREMILAFMAGAQPVPGNPGVKRASSSGGGVARGDILYKARSWVLADSELATPALVRPPLNAEPEGTSWLTEYTLFRDGVRNAGGQNPDTGGAQIQQGFGLRNPDDDGTVGASATDSRAGLKPVMSVVYVPANDMLHAFRAGPNISPSTDCDPTQSGHECGGQELWGFVPFDLLGALRLRLIHEPQGRDNHVYMLARGVRFSDVFVAVPSADNPPITVTVGSESTELNGVWRRILYIPRGIGGKYLTALDVTGPGPYTDQALDTLGPIPLWSRGNPDTNDGTGAGLDNNDAADRLAYSAMGETWSLPAVAFRDKSANTNSLYTTSRRPDGVDYALFMGSGYGAVGEGTTFFTLDALSGDVLADVDVETTAIANGIDRTNLSYRNALVANPVGFNPSAFALLQSVHPSASAPERIYIGDLHGRFWKILTKVPDQAIPIADLGADQPVGTAAAVLGMPPSPDTPVPFVFVSSGNDRRADGPFNNFAFRDDGNDDQVSIGTGVTSGTVTTFPPAVLLYSREYDQGQPEANCNYTEEAVFRGTVQPATAFDCGEQADPTKTTCSSPLGRVFFGGTRLNLPNTVFAPPTPLACGIGDYPCRSSFDSIIYVLGAKTGLAAYDLNASGDDAYRIFRDSRIAAISMLADPDPTRGGSSFSPDEGLMEGTPKPPPPPGVPPTGTNATASVVMKRNPGEPPPSVHYGSTVCQ